MTNQAIIESVDKHLTTLHSRSMVGAAEVRDILLDIRQLATEPVVAPELAPV